MALEVQLALKDEHLEFLQVRTVEWVRLPELGLNDEELDLMRLLIALASELALDSSFAKVGVSLLARLTYAGQGCAEGCAEGMEDIGMGEGDMDWTTRVEWLDGLRKANSSC